jgi:hypothetical protein
VEGRKRKAMDDDTSDTQNKKMKTGDEEPGE